MANFIPTRVREALHRFLKSRISEIRRDGLTPSEVCVRASKFCGCRIHADNLEDALLALNLDLRPGVDVTATGLMTIAAKQAAKGQSATVPEIPTEPTKKADPNVGRAECKPAPSGTAETLRQIKLAQTPAPAPQPTTPPAPAAKTRKTPNVLSYPQMKMLENWLQTNMQRITDARMIRDTICEAAAAELGFEVTRANTDMICEACGISLPVFRNRAPAPEASPDDLRAEVAALRAAVVTLYRDLGVAIPPNLTA